MVFDNKDADEDNIPSLVDWFGDLTIAAISEDPMQVNESPDEEPYMVPKPPRPSVNAIFDDPLEGLDSE